MSKVAIGSARWKPHTKTRQLNKLRGELRTTFHPVAFEGRASHVRASELARRAATVGSRFPVREPSLLSGVDVVATAVATVAVVGIGALVGLWLRKKRQAKPTAINSYVVGAYVLGAR